MGGVVKKITKGASKVARVLNPASIVTNKVHKAVLGDKMAKKLDPFFNPIEASVDMIGKETDKLVNPELPDIMGAAEQAEDTTKTVLGGIGSQSGEDREEEDKIELGRRRRGSGRGASGGRSTLLANQTGAPSKTGLKV